MAFKVTISPSFKKRLRRKPARQQGAILETIDRLAEDPRHPGLKTHRIRGMPHVWEARIDQSNRLSWEYGEPGEIVLISHCTHEQVLP
jgi:mRNA-degrading endonuclease RelE of RelBE toxin-antitoxin system